LQVGYSQTVGFFWAEILHTVHAALVKAAGFSDGALHHPTAHHGNVGLCTCGPSSIDRVCQRTVTQARMAWIEAESMRYKQKVRCVLWKAFAARGLGFRASETAFVSDLSLPPNCTWS
ncbi:putative extracellular elastinolytic metallo proteinase precursor, partial [Coprinopsis sp. MPI-PUGE-AT-0042]